MSTFRGVMVELPDIRVDFFRQIPGRRPPLACFLSHVHSDHLAGLESFKSPFLYCSAATKELLLRLERHPHRINFARGVLESRKQQYKHLKNLLKPIPLETPTRIELGPGNNIQVTLFDANHCTGAVMFLFENDGNAVLYTGDIRSEPWFVNNLARNPFLIEYTTGLKTLDCIYLDTSNLDPITFPTKAEGLKELLQKVSRYAADTVFHFSAWTFGYEEVWMALSKGLKSPIHVDAYRMRMYQSLRGDSTDKAQSGPFLAHAGPVLTGYKCGNTPQVGCLTSDPDARLHSCEKALPCSTLNDKTVWIRPIITRINGVEISEVGVGGGLGDLTQRPELELDSTYEIEQLLGLFANAEDRIAFKQMILKGLNSTRQAISLDNMGLDPDQDELSLTQLAKVVARSFSEKRNAKVKAVYADKAQDQALPRVITFPYSRHSSYAELCDLVRVFKPKDVYPCTVDEDNWHEGISIRSLFGSQCSASIFRHDREMRDLIEERDDDVASQRTHTTDRSESSQHPGSPEQVHAKTPQGPKRKLSLGRNSQGLMRLFDEEGKEVSVSAENVSKTAPAEATPNATPPRKIVAVSPGSESQNLRRKAVLEGLEEGRVKRARLQIDGNDSSPPAESTEHTQPSRPIEPNRPETIEISDDSSHAHTPGSEEDSDGDKSSQRAPFSAFTDENGREISYDSDGDDCFDGLEDYIEDDTFFDPVDQVTRCKLCGHELWREFIGFCTGCKAGQSGVPYFEILGAQAGARPDIEPNEYAEVDTDNRRAVVGDYLDDESSAYDSLDEDPKFSEEYEVNSFIDDDSQSSDGEDGASSGDGETDYQLRYNQLLTVHEMLVYDYDDLATEFREFRKDVLGSDFESDSDDMGERDDEGALVVEVAAPDPVVTELVLSQAQGQSQNSVIDGERIRDRAEAFEAALNANDGAWHNMSMVSINASHTHEEVEL